MMGFSLLICYNMLHPPPPFIYLLCIAFFAIDRYSRSKHERHEVCRSKNEGYNYVPTNSFLQHAKFHRISSTLSTFFRNSLGSRTFFPRVIIIILVNQNSFLMTDSTFSLFLRVWTETNTITRHREIHLQ